ncbi:MAG: hypothetical protein RBT11_13630 [Desulfobacterales bacterium]|jgi:hypothetical protein|nr:hypothetical protein [Desulfobacterales bacterium]
MSFKENLLKKIKIDALTDQIRLSIGPADGDRRLDTERMRELLSLSPMKKEMVRDLELYLLDSAAKEPMVLVLDNELAFYNTTVEDVAMRKSPTIKEMVSIRNAIKILNDKNVIVSKKEGSLETIHQMCLETLDLTYTKPDIESIAKDGMAALADFEPDGVKECLAMFAELVGFSSPPKPFQVLPHQIILAKVVLKPSGDVLCGPVLVYDPLANTLKLIEKQINSRDTEEMEWFRRVHQGLEPAPIEGEPVIAYLEKMVLSKMPRD